MLNPARWHPNDTRDVTYEDDLGVKIECGIVRFWTESEWRALPNNLWAWQFQRSDYGMRVWVPQVQLIIDHHMHTVYSFTAPKLLSLFDLDPALHPAIHTPLPSSPYTKESKTDCQIVSSKEVLHPVRLFEYLNKSGNNRLLRTCRLVCRHWVRHISPVAFQASNPGQRLHPILKDSQLNIERGITCSWVHNRYVPNPLWAWKLQRKDDTVVWVKKFLRSTISAAHWKQIPARNPLPPPYTSSLDTGSGTSSRKIALQVVLCALPKPGDIRLLEIYNFTCRDWVKGSPPGVFEDILLRQLPISKPLLRFEMDGGKIWTFVKKAMRYVPNTLWAWEFRINDKPNKEEWVSKLLRPNLSVTYYNQAVASSALPNHMLPGTRRRHTSGMTAHRLPPELFAYICDAADGESWSCRLVCRYWNKLCTPRLFERINVNGSPGRIRALWERTTALAHIPQTIRYVKVVENVPPYDDRSRFPWLHLLTQACNSTHSEWSGPKTTPSRSIFIEGPFPGAQPTIKSIHFAIPRSPLPQSFSRGITALILNDVRFRRFEDLTRLVCEQPDLEELRCYDLTFSSLPTECSRRRPRNSRNKLRRIEFWLCRPSMEETPGHALAMFTLLLSVYDTASFFSPNEIAIILVLLRLLHDLPNTVVLYYEYRPENGVRTLVMLSEFDIEYKESPESSSEFTFLSLQVLRTQSLSSYRIDFTVVVSCLYLGMDNGQDTNGWTEFDTKFGNTSPLIRSIRFVVGFADRKQMIGFATNILGRMPSITRHATIQFGICCDPVESTYQRRWHQASLESEEPLGDIKRDLADISL